MTLNTNDTQKVSSISQQKPLRWVFGAFRLSLGKFEVNANKLTTKKTFYYLNANAFNYLKHELSEWWWI